MSVSKASGRVPRQPMTRPLDPTSSSPIGHTPRAPARDWLVVVTGLCGERERRLCNSTRNRAAVVEQKLHIRDDVCLYKAAEPEHWFDPEFTRLFPSCPHIWPTFRVTSGPINRELITSADVNVTLYSSTLICNTHTHTHCRTGGSFMLLLEVFKKFSILDCLSDSCSLLRFKHDQNINYACVFMKVLNMSSTSTSSSINHLITC